MDLPALEDAVSGHLAELDLEITGRLVDGNPTVQVFDAVQRPPQLLAVISDQCTDRFLLTLGRYQFQEFAYRPPDQAAVIDTFCKIVTSHLRGEGRYGRDRPFFGLLGRSRPTYSIEVDGQLFTSVGG